MKKMIPNRSNINWVCFILTLNKSTIKNLQHPPPTSWIVKKCVAKDHSVQLVGIADALGDPPFGRLHCLLALAFSIFAFWIIEQYSTTSRNCSTKCQLLLFIADLIFFFRAQHTGTLGEIKAIRRLTECIRRSSDLLFFVFSKCVAKDHSAQLVGIANTLGDLPFGLLHPFLALPFSIFAFWIIEQYSTTSRNCSTKCRLLLFIADLIFFFRAQHTGTLGEIKAIRRLTECIRRSSDLLFFVFSVILFLFAK
ncbi:hypothetical protein H5410_036301 [Solanum commersonii]|uniref:Uncharacterized protein n=1 Tax=Solanum commersonii TaxID=4109 RepID=A0A9J5Y4D7_SOLCO|nr:hypothetical protein H5410_036301 [Solanum commersonii]